MAVTWPFRQATLWGNLTFNYMTEVMAEGVYEQALSYLGDPEVHAQIARFLEEERHHALGLRQHIAGVGPTVPEPVVEGFRALSRALGMVLGIRGTGAFMDHVYQLEQLGETWYGQLSDRFPAGSVESERYKAYRAQETVHSEWLEAYKRELAADPRAGEVEVVEFSSVVNAPVDDVFAFYTDTRSLTALMGIPVSCPEGITRFWNGADFHLRLGIPPFQLETDAHILTLEAPTFYIDRKTRVPFDFWEHHHHFTPLGPETTLLSDRLLVRPKMLPAVPQSLQPSPWKLGLLAMLWFRHMRTAQIFSSPSGRAFAAAERRRG